MKKFAWLLLLVLMLGGFLISSESTAQAECHYAYAYPWPVAYTNPDSFEMSYFSIGGSSANYMVSLGTLGGYDYTRGYVHIRGTVSVYGGTFDEVIISGGGWFPVTYSGGRCFGTIGNFTIRNGSDSQTVFIPAGTDIIYLVYSPDWRVDIVDEGILSFGATVGYGKLDSSTLDAKIAAQAAQAAANNTLNQISNPTYGLSALNTKINNLNTKIESLSTPVITKVSTTNGATASTTGVSPTIVITASGADKFGLSLDGTNWLDGFDINTGGSISGLSSGVNDIRVRAYDSSVPAEKRKYAYGNILIFGL
jgi:hypothetical protein